MSWSDGSVSISKMWIVSFIFAPQGKDKDDDYISTNITNLFQQCNIVILFSNSGLIYAHEIYELLFAVHLCRTIQKIISKYLTRVR